LIRLEKTLIKSFSGGPGGRFFKKAPLAAGGKKIIEKERKRKAGGPGRGTLLPAF
jgi:hypothetical protein